MTDEGVARCRCGHLWTVHLEGHCDGAQGRECECRGFYPEGWSRNTTHTCRGCKHDRSEHSGVSCRAVVGQDTVTERHFGGDGDTWTTQRSVDVRCSCQAFW
ncbi:hypothetical protein GCM10010329_30850 [Streptomyces spiroverticillatus]|uniref:Uncharacterized protein n=1 Tax=Streptomyces finlayi TaxID=67296 RepID=A0A918WW17_9ACTN|nr:hypothetical protein [Streptomyces finlayi]GHA06156.1 hypothetical protein GCM10010329_30850 [Streptomyces spiroverticillatus]GHC89796.1 hypothetical protein GCM10010334_23260 [Streptomyces finlayi]